MPHDNDTICNFSNWLTFVWLVAAFNSSAFPAWRRIRRQSSLRCRKQCQRRVASNADLAGVVLSLCFGPQSASQPEYFSHEVQTYVYYPFKESFDREQYWTDT